MFWKLSQSQIRASLFLKPLRFHALEWFEWSDIFSVNLRWPSETHWVAVENDAGMAAMIRQLIVRTCMERRLGLADIVDVAFGATAAEARIDSQH